MAIASRLELGAQYSVMNASDLLLNTIRKESQLISWYDPPSPRQTRPQSWLLAQSVNRPIASMWHLPAPVSSSVTSNSYPAARQESPVSTLQSRARTVAAVVGLKSSPPQRRTGCCAVAAAASVASRIVRMVAAVVIVDRMHGVTSSSALQPKQITEKENPQKSPKR